MARYGLGGCRRSLRAALSALRMASSWDASSKAMVFLQLGHGMLKPPRIFLKCSLKGFPHLGHSILILSVGSMAGP
jgi:hypothetical protein